MSNLPQSGQSNSPDSLTVTREEFRLQLRDLLEFLAQALGNVTGTYSTQTVDPLTLIFQGQPSLAVNAEPGASDASQRLVTSRWVRRYAVTPSATAPINPVQDQIWIDTSQAPPKMKQWQSTPSPGSWIEIRLGGGATGAGTNAVFFENDQTVTAAYTITAGKNAISAGPVTIASGVTVTVPSGSTWVIV